MHHFNKFYLCVYMLEFFSCKTVDDLLQDFSNHLIYLCHYTELE